jgi:hypothetical protein
MRQIMNLFNHNKRLKRFIKDLRPFNSIQKFIDIQLFKFIFIHMAVPSAPCLNSNKEVNTC